MSVSNKILNTTEDNIKSFYRNVVELERLKHRMDMLARHKEDIRNDIDTSNISLNSDIRGIDYSKNRVQTSNMSSIQETEIEMAFSRLEKQLENVEVEILDVKLSIRELERKISDTEFLINKLNSEAKEFIILRYREQKSCRVIGDKLHLSEATVWRLRETILGDLSKWHENYHKRNEGRKNWITKNQELMTFSAEQAVYASDLETL